MSSVTTQRRVLLLSQMDSNITRIGADGAHKDVLYVTCDRAVQGMGLRPLACWGCGFESCRGHGYLFLGSVVVVKQKSLHQAYHSSKDVPPSVVCLSVIVKPL